MEALAPVSFGRDCRGRTRRDERCPHVIGPARLYYAIALSAAALLLPLSIVHAQRRRETGAAVYRIDPQTSDVRLLVYRDGVLSTFGHDHVVSLKEFTGTIHLQPGWRNRAWSSRFRWIGSSSMMPRPSSRRRGFCQRTVEGGRCSHAHEYAEPCAPECPAISDDQSDRNKRAGGRQKFGRARSLGATRGREIKLAVPTTLKLEGDQLEASGAVELSHKQLGLKPFSALLGSLRVAEQMKFKYRIRASKEPM